MQRVLFHSTIFGPIHSRRLGSSLGINLMPNDGKICSFDCLYCEAGFNAQGAGTTGLPTAEVVGQLLEEKLCEMSEQTQPLDVITFSGNGEPTLHPEFEAIVDATLRLRDQYYPKAKVSVLSNSTRLASESVVRALKRVDNNILKLDSTNPETVRLLDRPTDPHFNPAKIIEQLKGFEGKVIVQTMLTRGSHEGIVVDNTTDAEIAGLIEAYKDIKPAEVMIYTIDRPTPEVSLQHITRQEMEAIGERIRVATGISVQVSA